MRSAHWRSCLALEFERRDARTVLAARRHDGALVVQKPFYPEGDDLCQVIIVYPPAGIAGGDELSTTIRAGSGTHALLTTPGAAKWYRSAGAWARTHVAIEALEASRIEWLPQETIIYESALADIVWEARLAPDARLIAWEVLCLGRRGSGEGFERGRCQLETRLWRDGKLVWLERGRIGPDSPLGRSAVGMNGHSVLGTAIVAAPAIDAAWLAMGRELTPRSGEAALTRLPGLLIARYRGDSSEAAREYFIALWKRLRMAVLGRPAMEPRIWCT